MRFHLHYVAGRAEDRLTFDLQPVVGARMGYTRHGRQDGVERFMRHYFLTAREITRITAVLEPAIVRAAFKARPRWRGTTDDGAAGAGLRAGGRQAAVQRRTTTSAGIPIQMLRILQVARERGLALHPLAIRALIRHERGGHLRCAETRLAGDALPGPAERAGRRAQPGRWRTLDRGPE